MRGASRARRRRAPVHRRAKPPWIVARCRDLLESPAVQHVHFRARLLDRDAGLQPRDQTGPMGRVTGSQTDGMMPGSARRRHAVSRRRSALRRLDLDLRAQDRRVQIESALPVGPAHDRDGGGSAAASCGSMSRPMAGRRPRNEKSVPSAYSPSTASASAPSRPAGTCRRHTDSRPRIRGCDRGRIRRTPTRTRSCAARRDACSAARRAVPARARAAGRSITAFSS